MFSLLIPLHALTRLGPAGRPASKGISGGPNRGAGHQPRPDLALGSCRLLSRATAELGACLSSHMEVLGGLACPLAPVPPPQPDWSP